MLTENNDSRPENSLESGNVVDGAIPGLESGTIDLPPPSRQALDWFYRRLSLSESDRNSLFVKRGLTNATVDALGFRSNPESNKALLLEMADHFPLEVLVESGLWKLDEAKVGETPKPNAQFYGMSLAEKRDASGKKVRDEQGEAVRECVWNHPILIPYFNEAGDLVHLRPHKGMMAGKAPQLYVVRQRQQPGKPPITRVHQALITEGEFKAAALWQVLGDTVSIAALPGITMAKPLFGEVQEWLETTGAQQVIVGYDSEDKGNATLPGFQADIHRRFDAQIWSRYLARQLSKDGYDARVCVMPDDWRDASGKTDWDGRLAALVAKLGLADGTALEWDKVRDQIRAQFLVVVQAAHPFGEFRNPKIFDAETERIIWRGLDKLSYEPCLPIGGDQEQVLARRFHRLAARLKRKDWFPLSAIRFLGLIARSYQATAGRYYKLKPLTEKYEEFWQHQQRLAREKGDDDAIRACVMVLRGRKTLKATKFGQIPETISDFYFQPQYVLKRINGTRTRMVIIRNVHGAVSPVVGLPWDELGSPVKLRDWLHKNITGASWDGGQSELTALHEDFAHAFVWKEVVEIPLRGYDAKSQNWFFEDMAFSADGEYAPDPKTGIFWIKNAGEIHGYSFARDSDGRARDREDDVFRQGVPSMHPGRKDSIPETTALFQDVLVKLPEALGGMEAFMALGMVFASAAGPEIFKEWSCFPGLWIHGEQGEGKSALVRWLIRIWGFSKDKGLPLPSDDQRTTLTLAALSGALGQYGELPLWLDEYQCGTASWVRSILKNSYDRAEGAKKDYGSSPREFLASVIVSGVATSSEPQTRSRFAHIQVSSQNRTADHYRWFQANSQEFYRLGRFLLRNRKRFVVSALEAMRTWIANESMHGVDDRARMVHGLAYAGLHAACEVFNVAVDLKSFRTWLADHCQRSAAEIQASVSVDLFWREVLNALESGAFGHTAAERRQYFSVIEDKLAISPVSEYQVKAGAGESFKAWKSYFLYFRPGPLIELLRVSKRRSGENLPISQSDLLSQMRTRPYWHLAKHPSGHRQKFGGKSTQTCWCIKVDFHPMGYVRIGDVDFDASLVQAGESPAAFLADSWVDPRKGDLFALLESLQPKRNEEGVA